MVYSTSRCPSCRQVIRRQTNPVKEIGMPFERCRHCGTIYLNSYKEEWITKSPIKRFFFFIQVSVWARAFILPLLIVGILAAIFDFNKTVIWILWPVLSLVWLVGGYFTHKNAEQADITASIERTKDPEYLNSLKRAGYKIYPIDDVADVTFDLHKTVMCSEKSNLNDKEIHFCRKCGQRLVKGSLYCNKCGEKVVNNNSR